MPEENLIEIREGEPISTEEEIAIILTYKQVKDLHEALQRFKGFNEELMTIWLHDQTKIPKKTIKKVIEYIRDYQKRFLQAQQ